MCCRFTILNVVKKKFQIYLLFQDKTNNSPFINESDEKKLYLDRVNKTISITIEYCLPLCLLP